MFEPGRLDVRELEVEEPQPGEAVVRMSAVGVCGTDLHSYKGEWERPTPIVLGHEGAGIVEAVGGEVAGVRPGDRVVLSWAPACGECGACRRNRPAACGPLSSAIGRGTLLGGRTGLSLDGETVYRGTATGALAERVVVAADAALPLPQDVPLEQAALLGYLSETVFVLPREGDGHARIRIFTPTRELPFAGHPVLGTAFVLGTPLQLDEIRLETASGVIPVRLERDGPRLVFGWMTQPLPSWRRYERERELLAALGIGGSELPVELYDLGPRHVYVALLDASSVSALAPDLNALADHDAGASCFARAESGWKTRMFAPALGVPEDPATGSAAGPLAVHLARHGWTSFGEEIQIRQGDEIGRPSVLHARADGVGERVERVEVGGSAVVVARGEFRL